VGSWLPPLRVRETSHGTLPLDTSAANRVVVVDFAAPHLSRGNPYPRTPTAARSGQCRGTRRALMDVRAKPDPDRAVHLDTATLPTTRSGLTRAGVSADGRLLFDVWRPPAFGSVRSRPGRIRTVRCQKGYQRDQERRASYVRGRGATQKAATSTPVTCANVMMTSPYPQRHHRLARGDCRILACGGRLFLKGAAP
jgi:hypothetical protein